MCPPALSCVQSHGVQMLPAPSRVPHEVSKLSLGAMQGEAGLGLRALLWGLLYLRTRDPNSPSFPNSGLGSNASHSFSLIWNLVLWKTCYLVIKRASGMSFGCVRPVPLLASGHRVFSSLLSVCLLTFPFSWKYFAILEWASFLFLRIAKPFA